MFVFATQSEIAHQAAGKENTAWMIPSDQMLHQQKKSPAKSSILLRKDTFYKMILYLSSF